MKETTMKVLLRGMALLLVLGAPAPLFAQVTQGDTPARAQVIAAAKEIMQTARYCTLITIGPDGQPQARIVDPFLPDSDLTIWIATNPLTRKVQEIHRDPRVTLLYFSAATFEYVTVVGTAMLDKDSLHKAGHWKGEWETLYKNQNRGEDYLLLRVSPSRLEVVSVRRGMRNDPKTWRPVILDVP
jgi:general stress protein 26